MCIRDRLLNPCALSNKDVSIAVSTIFSVILNPTEIPSGLLSYLETISNCGCTKLKCPRW